MQVQPGRLLFLLFYVMLHPVQLDAQTIPTSSFKNRAYIRSIGIQISSEDMPVYTYGIDGSWDGRNWNPVLTAVGGNDVYLFLFPNHSSNWKSTHYALPDGLEFRHVYGEDKNYHYNTDFRIFVDTLRIVDWTNLDQLIQEKRPDSTATGNLVIDSSRFARYHFRLLSGKKIRVEVRNAVTKVSDESYVIARLPAFPAIAAIGDLADENKQVALLRNRDSLQLKSDKLPFEADHTIVLGASVRSIVVLPKIYPGLNQIFIEYKIETGALPGNKWRRSPDRITSLFNFNNLESGKTYDLYLRYNNTPDTFSHYKIIVQQQWWQTAWFKLAGALLVATLFLLAAFLWYRRRQKRKLQSALLQQQLLAAEMKSIRSQLNPHFVFNAMSSIQNLINKKDIYNANQYLSLFSLLMRDVLANSEKTTITLEEELQTLHHYIELEKLRFGFDFSLDTNNVEDTGNVEFPAMLLQPLVENCVKHGISAMSAGGHISLDIIARDKNMIIELRDNGEGFDVQQAGTGFGLKSVQDRIELVNRSMTNRRITIVVASGKESGTGVLLTFFNWLP
jgi:hypothetical protein